MPEKILWPQNKIFAFTIFDDTDSAFLDNVGAVYSALKEYGLYTTKSVWPILGQRMPIGGATCEDEQYLNWLLSLKHDGFEIAWHNATFHSSLRQETIKGLEKFKELFGFYPKIMANHSGCQEGIYWGNYRLTGINEKIYNFFTFNKNKNVFRGHIKGDKFFWGDLCKEKIKYVRNFTFADINTLKACPYMPYHDPAREYVNYWFASSNGANVKDFNNCISERNQDRLESEGGACIMYTHFAKGFYEKSKINNRFNVLIKRLSKKNGWFVPVSELLDYLLSKKSANTITGKERNGLELKWLLYKITKGTN